jgi:hypothetical protein
MQRTCCAESSGSRSYFADQDRVPLIAGRILGWLMICDPPEQSAEEIAIAIGASRASLTTNLRLLNRIGFVRQLTRPGARTTYYRVDDHAWEAVVRRQIVSLTALGEITQAGMELVGPSTTRATRIRAAHDIFRWMQKVFAEAPPLRGSRPAKGAR